MKTRKSSPSKKVVALKVINESSGLNRKQIKPWLSLPFCYHAKTSIAPMLFGYYRTLTAEKVIVRPLKLSLLMPF